MRGFSSVEDMFSFIPGIREKGLVNEIINT